MKITRLVITLTDEEEAAYDFGKENPDLDASTRKDNRARIRREAEELAQGMANLTRGPIEVTLELPDLNDITSWDVQPDPSLTPR